MSDEHRRDLCESVLAWGELEPERIALAIRGHHVTFGELRQRVLSVSGDLQQRDFALGGAVGIYMRTSVAFLVCYLGAQHAGMTPLVINAMLGARELDEVFSRVRPEQLFVEAAFRGTAEEGVAGLTPSPRLAVVDTDQSLEVAFPECAGAEPRRRHTDIAAFMMTSATTGRPKAVRISHHSLTLSTFWCAWAMDLQVGATILSAVPLFYDMGLHTGSLPGLHMQNTVVVQERYAAPELVELLEEWRPATLLGTPTMHRRTIAEMERRSSTAESVRVVFSAGAALDPVTLDRLRRRFPAAAVKQLYGLTETRQVTSSGRGEDPPLASVGRPAPGVAVRLVGPTSEPVLGPGEVGEILVRSHGVMDGYQGADDGQSMTPAGWLRTGDLGSFDDRGWLHFAGRSKEMIVRGGANVYPREIEMVAALLPGVEEVAVVGRSHDELGEVPVLFYSVASDAQLGPEDVHAHCRKLLAKYKVPVEFIEVPDIPKNPSGKISKRTLVQMQSDGTLSTTLGE